jgi:hypothetical protein
MIKNDIKQQRHKMIAMVKISAKRLGFDSGSDDYRSWLKKLTGLTSCSELSDANLMALTTILRQKGLLDKKLTGNHADRPTEAQWRKMETLARQLGFANVDTPDFIAWVKKVTQIDNPRFLKKDSMSSVIAGLVRWVSFKKTKENDLAVQNSINQPKAQEA